MSTTATQAVGASVSAPWGAEISGAALRPEERLLALVVFSQLTQMDSAKVSVNMSFEELARLRQEVKEAVDKAKEAQHHSGFWGAISSVFGGDIGAIASAVAAVAAVVATGGAAAAVVAAVASAVSIAGQHAKELGIPPEVAMGIAIAAAGAALCCGNAGSLFHVSDTVRKVAMDAKIVAGIASGAANVAAGGASIVKGSYDADAKNAQADARAADGQQDLANMDIDDAIKLLSDVMDKQLVAFDTCNEGNSMNHRASDIILNNFAGAA
jgi:hypothetical protein